MNKIIIQPCGAPIAKENFRKTIGTPVDIGFISQFISGDDLAILNELYPDGGVPTWGVTPGKDGLKVPEWERIEKGDFTLFTGDKRIFASAVVTHKLRNEDLARELWGSDENGQTWEYLYFVAEIKIQKIPDTEFNLAVGYSPTARFQNFRVLDDAKPFVATNTFDFSSQTYLPDVTHAEFMEAVQGLIVQVPLDKSAVVNVRTEQAFLRNHLFKGKPLANCGICNNEYPVEFLVAAHIKKRSKCTLEEKLDFENIVVPMCKLGCDELYERGYICVNNGAVNSIPGKLETPGITDHIARVNNLSCKYWNENTSKYFNAHRESFQNDFGRGQVSFTRL